MENNEIDAVTKAAIAAASMSPNQRREALSAIGKKSAEAFASETRDAASARVGTLSIDAARYASAAQAYHSGEEPTETEPVAIRADFAAREALGAFAARTVPPRLATMQRPVDLRAVTRARELEDAYFRNRDSAEA